MDVLAEKRRARRAARRWLSRDIDRLEEVLSRCGVDSNKIELTTCLESVERRLKTLEIVQSEIEVLIDEDDIDQDIEEAAEHVDKYLAVKIKAEEALSRTNVSGDNEVSNISRASSSEHDNFSGNSNVSLPKLNLPKFNGNPLDFFSFWERFEVAVNGTRIPEVNKFIYLKSVLEGDALAAVRGLAVTPDNYCVAKDILRDRFGRKEKVIFHHVESLLNFKNLSNSKCIKELWSFRDEILGHIRSLDSLGIGGNQYGVFLTPIILNKLPVEVRLEWERSEGKESDIDYLMDFLYEEIKRKERSSLYQENSTQDRLGVRTQRDSRTTVSTFHSQNKQGCVVCGKLHKGKPEECFKLLKTPKSERFQLLREKKLCFVCLDKNHQANACKLECAVCHGRHHELICNQPQPTDPPPAFIVNHTNMSSRNCNTILQVLRVNVRDRVNGNKRCVNVLLDGGSDHTYVTTEVVQAIGPLKRGEIDMAFASFGSEKPSSMRSRNIYSLNLEGENEFRLQLDATEIRTICTPVFRPRLPPNAVEFIKMFPVLEDYENSELVKIDVLIGMDYMWSVLRGGSVSVPSSNLVLQQSVFGWVLSGSFKYDSQNVSCMVSHQLHCCEQYVPHFQNLWDLDSIGIREEEVIKDDELQILQNFEKTVVFEDGSYKVKLPWKGSCNERLLNNETIAKNRLSSLVKRLKNKPQLFDDYIKVFSDMENEGIIVEIPKEKVNEGQPIYYLPHHPVVKEASLTTKVRPVFDASCPGVNGVSLNDCLWSGPCLLPDLIAVLLRFRKWPIALTADVKQAFLNIRVHSEDTDAHRFLLPSSDGFKTMKFARVPFGNKASPFLLNATVKYHLSKYRETPTVKELKNSLYVDDWLTGSNTVEECLHMIEEATQIMSSASLPLTKWACNNSDVSKTLHLMSDSKNCLIIKDNSLKVLGVQWDREMDCLVFHGLIMEVHGCPSKRAVLSLIARLFDPLGLLSPFIMSVKILFQDIWRSGLEWDQPLPVPFRERLDRWMEGLIHVKQFHISRGYFSGQWNPDRIKGLFCFSDASEKAYGACVYLTVYQVDGSYTSTLVYAKSKVAPLRSVSLPRLELLGALLAARLVAFVRASLSLDDQVPCVCYTDSMVTLAWIKGNPTRWRTFVCNRVTEIQKLTQIENWYHVPGKENPADLISRGVSGETLVNSDLWLQGPTWLGHDEVSITKCIDESNVSIKKTVAAESVSSKQLLTLSDWSAVFDLSRWGTYNKAVRVVAWVLRFVRNAQHPLASSKAANLSVQELKRGEIKLVQHEQRNSYPQEVSCLLSKKPISRTSSVFKLNPFIDTDGLLRIQGRLEFSDLEYDEKCPILIPRGDLSLLLIRHYHIAMKHAGVDTLITAMRNKYWVVGIRRQAKKMKSRCIPCQIQDSAPCDQTTAPLPPERVTRAAVFSVCGIDFAGPLYCKDVPRRKFYVLLFTCAVVRAVHVELVDSLSVDDFLLGFIRFVCRRSLPTCIISDNAKTFISAKERLINHYGPQCPTWKFNAPLSPWWGAFWERMVRSIKSNLRKSVGNRLLTRCELESTLCEVESCVNSRPLTFVGDGMDSVKPLTPSHFLTPNGSAGMHDPNSGSTHSQVSDQWTLCDLYSNRCRVMETFWQRWSSEYLRNLPSMKTGKGRRSPMVGSLVMIRENEHHKRLQWPTGVITQIFPGRDGLVRAVEVKTTSGKVTRPIQRIHVLETANESNLSRVESINDIENDNAEAGQLIENEAGTSAEEPECNERYRPTQSATDMPQGVVNFQKPHLTKGGRVSKKPEKLNL